MALSDKIEERALRPHHIMVASMLAGLNEMGMLNQASVNVASRRAGRYLSDYAKARESLDSLAAGLSRTEKVHRLVRLLDELLELGTQVEVVEADTGFDVGILSAGCKFCPKGVGEAELKGALCPYPGMIEEFINAFLSPEEKIKLVSIDRRQLRKKGDNCSMLIR
jgi:hypothetical protein